MTISGPPIHADILDSIHRQNRTSGTLPYTPQQLFIDPDQIRDSVQHQTDSDSQIAPISNFNRSNSTTNFPQQINHHSNTTNSPQYNLWNAAQRAPLSLPYIDRFHRDSLSSDTSLQHDSSNISSLDSEELIKQSVDNPFIRPEHRGRTFEQLQTYHRDTSPKRTTNILTQPESLLFPNGSPNLVNTPPPTPSNTSNSTIILSSDSSSTPKSPKLKKFKGKAQSLRNKRNDKSPVALDFHMHSPPTTLDNTTKQLVSSTVSQLASKPPVEFYFDPDNIRNTPPALFAKHPQALSLAVWAAKRLREYDCLTAYQRQQGLATLKRKDLRLTFIADFEYKHLINHPIPELPPKGKFDTTPDPFICLQFHYNFDRYTRKTSGHAIFYNPNSGLQYAVDFSE